MEMKSKKESKDIEGKASHSDWKNPLIGSQIGNNRRSLPDKSHSIPIEKGTAKSSYLPSTVMEDILDKPPKLLACADSKDFLKDPNMLKHGGLEDSNASNLFGFRTTGTLEPE